MDNVHRRKYSLQLGFRTLDLLHLINTSVHGLSESPLSVTLAYLHGVLLDGVPWRRGHVRLGRGQPGHLLGRQLDVGRLHVLS